VLDLEEVDHEQEDQLQNSCEVELETARCQQHQLKEDQSLQVSGL